MLRQEKAAEVDVITQRLQGAKAAIVAEYRGLTVSQMTDLRARVRGAQAGLRVVKNRLALLAAKAAKVEGLDQHLVGPTALATATADPVLLAKALVEFAKEHELLKIKGGVVEGKSVSLAQLLALAHLPSRDVLLSQLLSVMNGPARNLASVLAAVPRAVVTVIKAIGDKKE